MSPTRSIRGLCPIEHDVFDEGFWTGEYAEHLKHEVMPFLGKKQFIGYFLDNEPEWNARPIWVFYLRLSQERPGSQAFVRYLKTYYRGSIGQLNRAWRTSYVSFDAIPGSHPRPRGAFPGEWAVMQAWRTKVAATYYRRYAAMVRALDPQHLILGIRYRGVPDMELFKALAPYFDVNSINDYNRYGHLRPVYAELYKASGKPLLITEFSFSGFPEPGQQSCLFIDVYTHERRGMGYHKYVLQAARAPFMVGMHWFMWMDYGRPDDAPAGYPYPPEQNVGLLSHDERVVYEELASWVTRANAEVEAAHRAARRAPRPAPQRRVLHRFTPTVDGALAEWPKALAIKPNRVDSLVDGVQANHTYFLSWDQEAVYLAGDISDAQLLHPQTEKDCWWAADYLALDVAAVKPSGALERSSALFLMYPLGTGAGGQQPYVAQWEGARGLQPVATQVAKRLRPGGYTIEARIPVTAMKGVKGGAGTVWNIKLRYQNVEEISQAHWEGVARFRP